MRDRPQHFARLGLDADQGVGMPDDQLPLAAQRADDRRRVARFRGAAGLPQLAAGLAVEGHDGLVLAADDGDQPPAIDQRRPGISVDRHFNAIVAHEVLLPYDMAGRRVETEQVAHRAQRIDLVVVNGRRGPRTGTVGDRVGAGVGLGPKLLAGGLVQADDPFLAGRLVAVVPLGLDVFRGPVGQYAVHHEDLSLGDGRPGETGSQGGIASGPAGPRRGSFPRSPARARRLRGPRRAIAANRRHGLPARDLPAQRSSGATVARFVGSWGFRFL